MYTAPAGSHELFPLEAGEVPDVYERYLDKGQAVSRLDADFGLSPAGV